MSIGEFTLLLKERNKACNQSGTRWASEFRQAGYFSAKLTERGLANWRAAHQWCKAEIGEEHYSWTGGLFWFEREEHVVLFLLKWN